jgi:hypothetical protein
MSERRAHSDSFVKRLNEITTRAISASVAEFDGVLEAWFSANEPASEGSAWLLEWVSEPMWLAAAQAPIRQWRFDHGMEGRIEPVRDANLAIRFAREIDAVNMARLLGVTGFYVAREHEFIANPQDTSPSSKDET